MNHPDPFHIDNFRPWLEDRVALTGQLPSAEEIKHWLRTRPHDHEMDEDLLDGVCNWVYQVRG